MLRPSWESCAAVAGELDQVVAGLSTWSERHIVALALLIVLGSFVAVAAVIAAVSLSQ